MKSSYLSRFGSSVPSSLFYGSGIPGDMSGLPGVFFDAADDGNLPAPTPAGDPPAPKAEDTDEVIKLFTPEQQAAFNKAQAAQKRKFDIEAEAIRIQAAQEARKEVAAEIAKAEQKKQQEEDVKQGRFQKIATDLEAEVKTKDEVIAALKPKAELYDAFVANETERINTRVKAYHPDVQALDPGPDAARFEERLAWLPKADGLQKTFDLVAKTYDNDMGKGGNGRTPNSDAQVRNELRKTGAYRT